MQPCRSVCAVVALGLFVPSVARADDHVRRTESGLAEHWPGNVVRVRFDPELLGETDASERAALIGSAAWAHVPRAPEIVVDGPTESPGPLPTDGENGIYLVHTWPFDPHLLAVTVSTVDPSTGVILDADVWVNADYSLALLDDGGEHPYRTWDAGALLSHELGHVLGLSENRDDAGATMWPDIPRGDSHQRTPDASDTASIAEAYTGVVPTEPGAMYSRAGCDAASTEGARGVNVVVPVIVAVAVWIGRRRNMAPARVR